MKHIRKVLEVIVLAHIYSIHQRMWLVKDNDGTTQCSVKANPQAPLGN